MSACVLGVPARRRYGIGFSLFAASGIRRYLWTLLGTYIVFLFSSVIAVFLIYMGPRLPFNPVVVVVFTTACGLYGPLLLVRPLARQVQTTLRSPWHPLEIALMPSGDRLWPRDGLVMAS